MNHSHKIFTSLFICLLILCGAGALGYEVLAMSLNSSSTHAMSQASNLKENFIHQLFSDLTPTPQPSTTLVANTPSDSSSNVSSSPHLQNNTSEQSLHFASQQDALQFAVKKFSPTELVSLMNDFTHPDQVTPQEVEELKQKIQSRFTQEELLALKKALDTN